MSLDYFFLPLNQFCWGRPWGDSRCPHPSWDGLLRVPFLLDLSPLCSALPPFNRASGCRTGNGLQCLLKDHTSLDILATPPDFLSLPFSPVNKRGAGHFFVPDTMEAGPAEHRRAASTPARPRKAFRSSRQTGRQAAVSMVTEEGVAAHARALEEDRQVHTLVHTLGNYMGVSSSGSFLGLSFFMCKVGIIVVGTAWCRFEDSVISISRFFVLAPLHPCKGVALGHRQLWLRDVCIYCIRHTRILNVAWA